jgi:hypothetical protein
MKKKFLVSFSLVVLSTIFSLENSSAQEITHEGDGTVMCSVSSSSSENYGRCYTTPSGGKNCALLATAGSLCNGTIIVN